MVPTPFHRRTGWRLLGGFALATSAAAQGIPSNFSERFNQADGTIVDSLAAWVGTTGAGAPTVQGHECVISLRTGTATAAFLRPWSASAMPPQAFNGALDLVDRAWSRIEFDLLPTFLTTNATGDDGRLVVDLAPVANGNGPITTEAGPIAAMELVADVLPGGAIAARVDIRARGPSGSQVSLVRSIALPDFQTVARRVAFEFGWDYYRLPGRHQFLGGSWVDQIGKRWIYARVQYFDGLQWVNPVAAAGADPATNGWVMFGTDLRHGYTNGNALVNKIRFDKVDWANASAIPSDPRVFPYFRAEQVGSADVDWHFDNVGISANRPPPFTLFVNTLAYDTAGPQWAELRPNQAKYRDNGELDAMTIQSAEIRRANGTVLRTIVPATQILAGQASFKELDDFETFPYPDPNFKTVNWRRIEWSPVTDPEPGCTLRLVVSTTDGAFLNHSIVSRPFDFADGAAFESTWRGIALDNEQARRAVPTPDTPNPTGGWFDAGNENGEARAHGLFVSGLAHLLATRRPELTTDDLRGLLAATEYGDDFLLQLARLENESTLPLVLDRILQHGNLLQGCGGDDAGHYLDLSDPLSRRGHVWEEHHSRRSGSTPTNEAYSDDPNTEDRVFYVCYGLAQSVAPLKRFASPLAATVLTQAADMRDYLYDLDDRCGLAPDAVVTFRAQAALDIALFEAGAAPPAGYGGGAAGNLQAARDKLIADLTQFDPTNPATTDYREWVSNRHALHDPANHPWLGLARMIDLGQPDPGGTLPSWQMALEAIAQRYYVLEVAPNNPLHLPRFWGGIQTPADFRGTVQRPNESAAYEAHGIAHLATVVGPSSASFIPLRELAVGGFNWLFGIHYGVRGRYLLPPSDREWDCGSFVIALGSSEVVQALIGLHQWNTPSTVGGCGGDLWAQGDPASNEGPGLPPWTYTPQNFGNTETFIRRDGNLLILTERLDRLLHPRRSYEAEIAESYFTSNPLLQIVGNNSPGHPNGGRSVVHSQPGDWLRWDVCPPDPAAGVRQYWLDLRVANGATLTYTVRVETSIAATGALVHYDDLLVAPTGDPNEYGLVRSSLPMLLDSGVAYQLKVTFLDGPVPLDNVMLTSRGIP